MNFGMITLSLSMVIKHDYVTGIRIALLSMLKHDFYKDIASDVDNWFDTSIYDKNDNRPLKIGKTKRLLVNLKMSQVVKS